METTQTTRQQKIARQIQRDIAEILQKEGPALVCGAMVTVTTVRISSDLAYAKVYFSIFPFERNAEVMESLDRNNKFIRHELGRRIRNQLKIVPELQFFLDDSLEYIRNIDSLLTK